MLSRITRNIKVSLFIVMGILVLHAYSGAEAMRSHVKQVEAGVVCMVNDEVMGKAQIPVEFEGKTYYGCCEGCVDKLKSDRGARYSRDPVTGREVDKAAAVIVEGPEGQAFYFESLDSAMRFKPARR